MKKTFLSLLLFSSLASANDDPFLLFDASAPKYNNVTIEWRAVDDVQKECEKESRNRGNNGFGFRLNACAFWQGNNCTIITKRRVNMHTLGHEVRHCFFENWH